MSVLVVVLTTGVATNAGSISVPLVVYCGISASAPVVAYEMRSESLPVVVYKTGSVLVVTLVPE